MLPSVHSIRVDVPGHPAILHPVHCRGGCAIRRVRPGSRAQGIGHLYFKCKGIIGYCRNGATLSARNSGIFRAGIHIMSITALVFAAPFARAVGAGLHASHAHVLRDQHKRRTDPGSLCGQQDANTANGPAPTYPGPDIAGSGAATSTRVAVAGDRDDLTIDGFSQPGARRTRIAATTVDSNAQLTVEIVVAPAAAFTAARQSGTT